MSNVLRLIAKGGEVVNGKVSVTANRMPIPGEIANLDISGDVSVEAIFIMTDGNYIRLLDWREGTEALPCFDLPFTIKESD